MKTKDEAVFWSQGAGWHCLADSHRISVVVWQMSAELVTRWKGASRHFCVLSHEVDERKHQVLERSNLDSSRSVLSSSSVTGLAATLSK